MAKSKPKPKAISKKQCEATKGMTWNATLQKCVKTRQTIVERLSK